MKPGAMCAPTMRPDCRGIAVDSRQRRVSDKRHTTQRRMNFVTLT